MNSHTHLLQETPMLDFKHKSIQHLIQSRNWHKLSEFDRIKNTYTFVKDEIDFGYNFDDTYKASQVLADGYGQCNTKGTLLMALLRAVKIPCRIHGFTIYNELQKGAIPPYLFLFAPKRIIHSWVEVFYKGNWLNLEGCILDDKYLAQVQTKFSQTYDSFSAYGIATKCLKNPKVDWQGQSTYIQNEGIADDYGIYDRPDDFYKDKGSNLKGCKRFLYRYLFRHIMNININRIRRNGII
jgi:hypothetical protein